MAKVRFQLPKSSLDTKQRRSQLSVTLPVQCAAREASHISHTSPESEGRQWGPAIVLQLLRIFLFFFSQPEKNCILYGDSSASQGAAVGEMFSFLEYYCTEVPSAACAHKLVGHLSMTLAVPPPPRMDGKRSVLLLSTGVLLNKS